MLTALIAWVAGAATAIAVGLFALSSIDFGLSDRSASPALGDSSPVAPEATPSGATDAPDRALSSPAGAQPNSVERTFTSAGGTVVARCTPEGAYLVSWSPAQGFHSENVHRGPATLVSVQFEARIAEYTTRVTCAKGVPQGKVSADH
jgi:hypothetical protein